MVGLGLVAGVLVIAAMVLCAHLVAAKAVTNCKAAPGDATFDTATGHGMVLMADEQLWGRLTDPGPGTPQERASRPAGERRLQSILGGAAGVTVLDGPLSHVILSVGGAVPDAMTWWLKSIEFQCEALQEKRDAEAIIAEERGNPGGVVDLERLHTFGENLADARIRLAANAAEYKKATGLAMVAGL